MRPVTVLSLIHISRPFHHVDDHTPLYPVYHRRMHEERQTTYHLADYPALCIYSEMCIRDSLKNSADYDKLRDAHLEKIKKEERKKVKKKERRN